MLTAMGHPPEIGGSVVRFSFYKQNTAADVDRVIEVLPGIVARVEKLSDALSA